MTEINSLHSTVQFNFAQYLITTFILYFYSLFQGGNVIVKKLIMNLINVFEQLIGFEYLGLADTAVIYWVFIKFFQKKGIEFVS